MPRAVFDGSGLFLEPGGKSRVAPKSKAKHSTKPVGPFSKDRRLTTLDARGKVGRLLRQTRLDLTEQVGGDPSPAEALIIQSAALKAARLFLLSEKLIGGDDLAEGSDHHALAWLNSMRLDLMALGLGRRIRDITPDLSTILREHSAEQSALEQSTSEFLSTEDAE
jgi:hypothetical protein